MRFLALNWKVSSAKVKNQLAKEDRFDGYSGSLECVVSDASGNSKTKTVYLGLYREKKQFGSQQELVWTVTICDIMNN